MNHQPPESMAPDYRRHAVRNVFLEAVIVTALGVMVAFGINWLSPRGLSLNRNYFPADINRPMPSAGDGRVPGNPAGTNAPELSPARLLVERLKQHGLGLVDGSQAVQLFHASGFQDQAIVFIDARDETHYLAGHIPGAYEFDPYYPEKYFTNVLPACQSAKQIVVYCHGGDCDDSESAALTLKDVGIAVTKLFIYGGGITEWTTNGLPVETGTRNSGHLRHLSP